MANMFNEDGTYNKTEWKAGDKITAVKLNKIELSLEAINNNDIDRHVEADNRLDILEERMNNTPDNEQMDALEDMVKDMVKDNKDEVDLAVYGINQKIESLESEVEEFERDLNYLNHEIKRLNDEKNDYILIKPNEYTNISNDILDAFNKSSHVKIAKGVYYIDTLEFPKNNLTLSSEDEVTLIMTKMIGLHIPGKINTRIYNIKIDGSNILSETDPENGSTAIYFSNSENISIDSVTTLNTGAWGIAITDNSSKITISNCKCFESARQSGIAISGDCTDFYLSNNKTYHNYYAGIIVEPNCKNGFVVNNIVCNNIENGIIVVGNDDSNIIISGNIVCDNEKLGVTCIKSSGVDIFDNTITDCERGLFITDVESCVFRENTIKNTRYSGLYMYKNENSKYNMTDISVLDNLIINSCIDTSAAHEASFFIRDCSNLVFKGNVSKTSKKDFTVVGNTFAIFDVYRYSTSSQQSDLVFVNKPFDFVLELSSSNKKISIVAPYDMQIYGYKLKRKIVSTSDSGDMYTQIKFDGAAYGNHHNETDNVGNTLYSSYMGYRNIKKDQIFTIEYVHSYNYDYVSELELELLYV